METLCPLCNGLIGEKVICPICGLKMGDKGQVENFYEPYSPYEDDFLMEAPNILSNPSEWCSHVFICPRCDFVSIKPIKQMKNSHFFG